MKQVSPLGLIPSILCFVLPPTRPYCWAPNQPFSQNTDAPYLPFPALLIHFGSSALAQLPDSLSSEYNFILPQVHTSGHALITWNASFAHVFPSGGIPFTTSFLPNLPPAHLLSVNYISNSYSFFWTQFPFHPFVKTSPNTPSLCREVPWVVPLYPGPLSVITLTSQ